jgi:hypothetical protein
VSANASLFITEKSPEKQRHAFYTDRILQNCVIVLASNSTTALGNSLNLRCFLGSEWLLSGEDRFGAAPTHP